MTLREQAAITAMSAILGRDTDIHLADRGTVEFVARTSVEAADALVARLDRTRMGKS